MVLRSILIGIFIASATMRRNKLIYGLPWVVFCVISLNLIFMVQQFRLQDSGTEATDFEIKSESDIVSPAGSDLAETHYRNENFSITPHEVQNFSHGIQPIKTWTKPSENELEQALVLGSKRNISGFLTIGIPTVQRETKHYLSQTIDSLISKSSLKERSDVTLLIFLADFEEEKRSTLKDMIKNKYSPYLENGFMQVIQAPSSFYPSLENLKSNYGDSESRIYWRSKQCVDFAFMFFYGSRLSEYYLQIEDDVYTVGGYLTTIRNYIKEKSNVEWASLEFSPMGFIGKLFHGYDLDRLATLTLLFYQDQPVDWIFRYFKDLNAQHKNYVRNPGIFQHRGFQSSLKEKDTKNWVDKTFVDDDDDEVFLGADNPPGTVYSNIEAFEQYLPQLSYRNTSEFFWGKKPQKDDVVVLVFDKPTHISRLAIKTGSSQHPADRLEDAAVELSTDLLQDGSASELPKCGTFVEVGQFFIGGIDLDLQEKFTSKVACLRIILKQSQKEWAIIRQIGIWIPR